MFLFINEIIIIIYLLYVLITASGLQGEKPLVDW